MTPNPLWQSTYKKNEQSTITTAAPPEAPAVTAPIPIALPESVIVSQPVLRGSAVDAIPDVSEEKEVIQSTPIHMQPLSTEVEVRGEVEKAYDDVKMGEESIQLLTMFKLFKEGAETKPALDKESEAGAGDKADSGTSSPLIISAPASPSNSAASTPVKNGWW